MLPVCTDSVLRFEPRKIKSNHLILMDLALDHLNGDHVAKQPMALIVIELLIFQVATHYADIAKSLA